MDIIGQQYDAPLPDKNKYNLCGNDQNAVN